ncbi:hypothetical protein ACFYNM_37265 [Streptomyces spororaveus]|uniref:hypothetical protein n=1 Tax=Streptomyces spororaveus TaxID=284039 RepID=UPI0036922A21
MNEAVEPQPPVPFIAGPRRWGPSTGPSKDAQRSDADSPKTTTAASSRDSGRHPALAALLMLREVREQLAGWESSLIETARGRGATWAGPDDERGLLSPL